MNPSPLEIKPPNAAQNTQFLGQCRDRSLNRGNPNFAGAGAGSTLRRGTSLETDPASSGR